MTTRHLHAGPDGTSFAALSERLEDGEMILAAWLGPPLGSTLCPISTESGFERTVSAAIAGQITELTFYAAPAGGPDHAYPGPPRSIKPNMHPVAQPGWSRPYKSDLGPDWLEVYEGAEIRERPDGLAYRLRDESGGWDEETILEIPSRWKQLVPGFEFMWNPLGYGPILFRHQIKDE